MKPVDERRHSFAFETRKVYSFSGEHSLSHHKDFSKTCDVSFDADKFSLHSSADSLDACSLGSDAGHSCNEKSHKPRKNATSDALRRKTSAARMTPDASSFSTGLMARPKSSTPSNGSRPVRKSLVDRQTDYSEKMKTGSLQRTSSPRV